MVNWDEWFDGSTPVDYVGYIAMLCATMIYVPQIRATYKAKSGEGLSYGMIFVELITDVLWNIYAQIEDLKPLILSSGFLFISCCTVLVMKIVYGSKWYHQRILNQVNRNSNVSIQGKEYGRDDSG